MIESIAISSVATYASVPERLDGLSKFNFLFGSNGTGKTTVSRVIAGEFNYPTCTVTWSGGTRLQPFVYNYDFVEKVFWQSTELKGVFTLGPEHVDTLSKIEKAKGELDALTDKIVSLTQGLQGLDGNGGKKGELTVLEAQFKETCWAQKQKHDTKLQSAFDGYRNNAEKFKSKIIEEYENNRDSLLTLVELEKKAESVFGNTPRIEELVVSVDMSTLIEYEVNPILKKRVIGRNDIDIAAMITKLNNSDWVREGRKFYDASGQVCPFCQQETTEIFAQNLGAYFDEAFVSDSRVVDELAANYARHAARIQQQISGIIMSPSKFLDVEKLKIQKELIDAKVALNNQRLNEKKKEASQVVELESLSNVSNEIIILIGRANTEILAHNKMVANLTAERAILKSQVWRFVTEEIKYEYAEFSMKKSSLNKAIKAMTANISTATEAKEKKASEIRQLEKQTTSIQPTIDGINSILSFFGFQGFKLAKAESALSYKLVRMDGSDAKHTLSEGEKTFITFLYFYYLLKGSESDTGVITDRIVVFDDPVSSLDSDILFMVGSLIKGLFDEVRTGAGYIKQIFILTHNVYFYKEVTYNSKRTGIAMNEETFWIVRKPSQSSKIDKYAMNPIKTSYELLWAEVRRSDRSNLVIQNTLRRILENYFKILGGIDFDDLCNMFDGREKLICNSLCSWLHDGSHYAHDDLYVSIDDTMVDSYLKVFRAIFEKSGHNAHYKMMMGDAYVEVAPICSTTDPHSTYVE
jgi:wobble nucleotide-excising tRNase